MGLRIRTNDSSLRAQRHLSKTSERLVSDMEQLSSGYRINKSADDAAGLAISEGLRAKIRSLRQARRNGHDGVSLVQVAEGSMNEITNILVRLRELAIQAASDTIGNTERGYINREYTQLVDEVDRIGKTTEFNGIQLLGGSDANDGLEELSIHIGAGDASMPNTDAIEINLEEIKINAEEVLQLGREAELGPLEPGDDFTRDIAAGKLNVLDEALRKVASSRAFLGAKQSRLQSAVSNLDIHIENLETAKSRVRDVDFAEATAAFTQDRILGQAGASVLSQANAAPELALTLLR